MSLTQLKALLVRHEGLKLKPYTDTVGKITIGVGRNLDDVGISSEEAFQLLEHDIEKANDQIAALKLGLDEVRTDVLIDMAFNLGIGKLLGFTTMFEAIHQQDWTAASQAMLNSHWAIQVGTRATELSLMMLTGQYPEFLRRAESTLQ